MISVRNKVQLIGNLGKAPETRDTKKGKVTQFPLATNEPYKDKEGNKRKHTEWHNIVCWGKTSDVAESYLEKGSEVLIEGKIRTSSWEDSEGNKKYKTEIHADQIVMMSRNTGTNLNENISDDVLPQKQKDSTPPSDTGVEEEDDDLPF